MSAKKKVLAAASYVMVAALAIGGTVAYFTASDSAVNVMTVGKGVSIEMNEQQRDGNGGLEDFEQGKGMMPATDMTKVALPNEDGYTGLTIRDGGNYVDKLVSVTNTGTTAAYVRTIYAFPEAGDFDTTYNASEQWFHWNGYSDTDGDVDNGWMWGRDKVTEWPANTDNWDVQENVEIDGKKYDLYIVTNKNPLKPGETTAPSLAGVYLDARVDCQTYPDGTLNYTFKDASGKVYNLGDISTLEVLAYTQAVQANGFADAWAAFDASGLPDNPWAATADAAVNKYTTAGTYYVNDTIIIDGTNADCVEADGKDVVVNITGGQYSTAKPDCAVWVKNGATVNISGGYFSCGARDVVNSASHSDLIYVGAGGGTINISGGFFTSETAGDWILNLKDNQGGTISVTGGTFVNFNPAEGGTESPAVSFVAAGYKVVEETKSNGDVWYTVVAE